MQGIPLPEAQPSASVHVPLRGREIAIAAAGFCALTVAATWPLARVWTSRLAGDFGDGLFVAWVMAWVGRHLTALAAGDFDAWRRMWDAPIFAPEPTTLAYSEHFTLQAALALPVSWAGGGPIAAYNAAFFTTFWLSALGAWLLVRVLTGRRDAAVVAGVLYGFNAYRLFSMGHLHTLSAQWPPFAMAGLYLFARRGSPWALAGAAGAGIATALSSAYYLAYFAPLLAAFAAVVLWREHGWRTRRSGVALGVAAAVSVAVVLPFVAPYVAVQRMLGVVRGRGEIDAYSLTLDTYAAVFGYLAPTLLLAATSVLAWRRAGRPWRWAVAFLGVAAVLAFWLSLGPTPRWRGAPLGVPGLYALLLDLPGFSGLRAAQRVAMVLMLALATLAGLGTALLAGWSRRVAWSVAGAALAVHAWFYSSQPLAFDIPLPVAALAPVPAYLDPARPLAPVYAALPQGDAAAVVIELPFGEPAYELRYMFAGLSHGHRLVNGYSGVFPASYLARARVLREPWGDPEAAWRALAPARYAVVHGSAWRADRADAILRWLETRGARRTAPADGATLWELPVWPAPAPR